MRYIFNLSVILLLFTACNRKIGNRSNSKLSSNNAPEMKADAASMINKFGFSFFEYIYNEDKNLIYSPISVSSAMAMLYLGAENQTAKELAQAFAFGPVSHTMQAFSLLQDTLTHYSTGKDISIAMANAIWVAEGYQVENKYTGDLKKYFNSEVNAINVSSSNKIEESRNKINYWVEDKTKNNIRNLVPEGVINELTRLLLTNAVYFKGPWKYTFDSNSTHKDVFYLHSGALDSTSFMVKTATYRIVEKEKFDAIAIPYQEDEFSFLLIKPKSRLICELSQLGLPYSLKSLMDEMNVSQVELHLPSFSFGENYQMTKTLQEMGVKDLFTNEADLSGISGNKELKVDAVLHKAKIDINENGTEAAAATAVVIGVKSAPAQPPVIFKADKPFVFFIVNNATGTALFAGAFNKPGKNSEN